MANGKNRLFWLTSLAIASIPLAVTFFGIYSDRRWLTILSFVLFIVCLLLSTCTFLSWKTFKFSTPIILQILRAISVALTPLAHILRGIPVIGKVANGSIKLVFWSWFIILMFSDVLVRKLLKAFVGLHEPSAGQYSTVNACDTNFQPCGEFGKVLDKEKVRRIEEGGRDFERDHDYDERKVVLKRRASESNKSSTAVSGHRRSKERPKSLDLRLRTAGKQGSDLSSMTGADWAKVLEMANIDKSRFAQDEISNEHDPAQEHSTTDHYAATEPTTDRPRYSQPIATTLAMVSKLVYEDVPVIRHELARSGYDMHSFRAIAYRNTVGFIVQKGRNIVLVFRGTDPLNLQNAWTDIQSRLVPIETLQDPPVPLGKCHQGMYSALGKADNFMLPSEELAQQQRELSQRHHRRYSDTDMDEDDYSLHLSEFSPAHRPHISPASSFRSEVSKANTLNLELSNHSIYQTIVTSIRAAYMLIKFLIVGLFTHVADPVDYRFAGEVRDLSAFAQACRWVDGLRLEHAEKEFKKMQKLDKTSKVTHYRGSTSGSQRLTRSNSLGSLYSQDEVDYLGNFDLQDGGRKRRPSITSHESFKDSARKLSLTGMRTMGQGHHQRKLSGQGSYRKDSFHPPDSWMDIGNFILDIYNNQYHNEQEGKIKRKRLRFYICGHSLGGALATIFLAKMVQCNSPLLDIFSGLYTYGQPRIGDRDFSNAFGYKLACKMFHHVHNNDIFARMPFWGTYETPPGTLVFMDSSRNLTLYPPDPVTLMPVPVRGISFMHLSGILNVRVIMRMRKESWLRILERIVLPFFLNDHFPGDYVKALAEGKIEVVVQDTARFGGVDEAETGSPVQSGYFSFFNRRKKMTTPAVGTHGHAVDKMLSRRPSYAESGNGPFIPMEPLSGDIDSGYGAENSIADKDLSKARRRIVKYTYRQDGDDDEDSYHGNGSRRSIYRDNDMEGEMRWKQLALEPEPERQRHSKRRSRSSSQSRSSRNSMRMQRTRRGSVGQRQPRNQVSTFEFS
ncbi:hypothetical protein BC939DRAFT_460962 [Gamsiella multidivaricata]|uniref:uncharacterized protein n=1 Tax=Gamsiella multidivaricata TaxID=101098 RepID=UPI0022210C8B|nr:uncharacterized protein BC939DRAFT_460962 [Gamsiella multidivaricata]KAG0369897.1 hypothetical protein BGZ54_008466 [Gamsiella multidivaricata]KAI7819167.1 hypothetical protein BC939DRAFT_460962 [Gamsiella multidivaricata]